MVSRFHSDELALMNLFLEENGFSLSNYGLPQKKKYLSNWRNGLSVEDGLSE